MNQHFNRLFFSTLFALAAFPVQARQVDALAGLINAYRAAPGTCDGRPARPVAKLTPQGALSKVRLGTGMFLDLALEREGYRVERAEIITVYGADSARGAMADIEQTYCQTLLDARFTDVGTHRTGDSWQIILARPVQPLPLAQSPDLSNFRQTILAAVNQARASGTVCGNEPYPAVPPLAWNDVLGKAARAHSLDMATQRYFSHQGKDGRMAETRAAAAGYHWSRIGENIAVGQESAEEVVDGWLKSPGHCTNIMASGFTEMGASYAIYDKLGKPRVYWTQMFGRPR